MMEEGATEPRRRRADSRLPRPGAAVAAALVSVLLLAGLSSCTVSSGPSSTRSAGPVVIATGGSRGVYYQYGQALADRLRATDPGLDVIVRPTSGSVENLRLLDRAEVTCAFVAGDAAAEAVTGRAPFRHSVPIVALARVYDDYLHLVTRRDGGIRELADLTGRRVSLGPPASGTRLMVGRLIDLAGVRPADLDESALGIDESLAALEAGQIDAFFWSGGVPTSGVRELGDRVALRLVPVEQYAAELRDRYDGVYRPATIPVGTYGLADSVGTLAVPNDIVCRSDLDSATVDLLVRTLFAGREEMGRLVPQALALDRRAAIETDPVPLHPAAADWFRRTKP